MQGIQCSKQTNWCCRPLETKLCDSIYLLVALIICHIRRSIAAFSYGFICNRIASLSMRLRLPVYTIPIETVAEIGSFCKRWQKWNGFMTIRFHISFKRLNHIYLNTVTFLARNLTSSRRPRGDCSADLQSLGKRLYRLRVNASVAFHAASKSWNRVDLKPRPCNPCLHLRSGIYPSFKMAQKHQLKQAYNLYCFILLNFGSKVVRWGVGYILNNRYIFRVVWM